MSPKPPDAEANPSSGISRILARVRNLLLAVSAALALGASPFGLDLAIGSLLGSSVVVLNVMGSAWPIRQLLLHQHIHPLLVIFQLLKLGLSGLVLYVALVHYDVSATGLLIGLSNILFTALIYAVLDSGLPGDESPPANS